MTVTELKTRAKELKIKNWWLMKKADLETAISSLCEDEGCPQSDIPHVCLNSPEELVEEESVEPQGEHESVEDYISRGGQITVLPSIEFPAPKPPRESSAMKANPDMPKKTPRRVTRKDSAFHAEVKAKPERKRPTKPNGGTQVEDKPAKGYGTRKQDIIAKAQHGLKLIGKGPKANPDMVTLSSLTEGRDIEGRILRRMLRNSEIEKPGAQWEWPVGHEDIAKVQSLIDKRWI